MSARTKRRGTLRIGTSGWSYRHWADGRFYPKGLPQREWLSHLAKHFDTVELNASFYRPPQESAIEKWRDETPNRFRFAIKLWRMITHQKKLNDCEEQLARFLPLFDPLERQRGPLLVQLPPSLGSDLDRLDAFLRSIKSASGRSRWKVTVEFRHAGWLTDEVYELLDAHRASICLADMPRCPITEPNDATFIYIRRHGPDGEYRASDDDNALRRDAKRIDAWLADGRDVWIYFNNDAEGYAIDNAFRLRELVGA